MNLFRMQLQTLPVAVARRDTERRKEQEKMDALKERARVLATTDAAAAIAERTAKILKQVSDGVEVSSQIATAVGCTRSTVFKILVSLEKEGKIVRSGTQKRTKWHPADDGAKPATPDQRH